MLALHGHGYGVKAIIGIYEEGIYRTVPAGYRQDSPRSWSTADSRGGP